MKAFASGVLILVALAGLVQEVSAARVLGCCVRDDRCGPLAEEQVSCLLHDGDLITAASGARCASVPNSPLPGSGTTPLCTCDGLGTELSGLELLAALDQLGLCRQLPKGKVCNCPAVSLPTASPSPTPTRTPIPTVGGPATPTAGPAGCCQFVGPPITCRQTTIGNGKRPGSPAVFVQNANCHADGRCLIVPEESRPVRIPVSRLRPARPPRPNRP